MKPRHQATKASIELIKSFEGLRRRAARLADGSWTIGYGHTRTARQGVEISESDADGLLVYDLATVVRAINEWVYSPLTQNQFDALVAFVFNIGVPNFRSSSVLRRLNEGSHLQAACAMEMWRTADFEGERIVIDALVRRRSAEMALFLTPQDGYVPVPSLVIMPRVDDQVARAAPGYTAEIETALEGQHAQTQRTDEPMPSAGLAALQAVSARLGAMLQDPLPEPVAAKPAPPLDEDPAPPKAMAEAVAALAAVVSAPAAPEPAAPQPAAPPLMVVKPIASPVAQQVETLAAMLARGNCPLSEPMIEPGPEPKIEPKPEPEVLAQAPAAADGPIAEPAPLAFTLLAKTLSGRKKTTMGAPEPVLALVGLVGLAVFAAGIFWGFSAKASERLPLGADPVAAGWGLGLVGIALAATSVYFLLNRLGAKSE